MSDDIKRLRTERGLNQVELAERARISRTYLGNMERGKSTALVETMVGLACALDVPITELLEGM